MSIIPQLKKKDKLFPGKYSQDRRNEHCSNDKSTFCLFWRELLMMTVGWNLSIFALQVSGTNNRKKYTRSHLFWGTIFQTRGHQMGKSSHQKFPILFLGLATSGPKFKGTLKIHFQNGHSPADSRRFNRTTAHASQHWQLRYQVHKKQNKLMPPVPSFISSKNSFRLWFLKRIACMLFLNRSSNWLALLRLRMKMAAHHLLWVLE